jgi:trimeric autotransporter adhesin
MAATTSVAVAATSASAPSTSPVIPPSRRTACRSTASAAARPAATASGNVQPSGSLVTLTETSTAATAAARAASVTAATVAGRTVPATSAPSPSDRAAGTPRRQAQVSASLPVMTAAISAAGPRSGPADSAWASAANWISKAKISVMVPNGPMSERRMMSRATGAG